jgi:hypothetical protein
LFAVVGRRRSGLLLRVLRIVAHFPLPRTPPTPHQPPQATSHQQPHQPTSTAHTHTHTHTHTLLHTHRSPSRSPSPYILTAEVVFHPSG